MKKSAIVFGYMLFSLGLCFASRPSVLFSTCAFDNPSGKPYIEVYLNTAGKSVTAVKKPDGKYQGTIQVQLLVKKDRTVVYADKYNLNSMLSATPVLDSDFVDVQRIVLENGTYTLEVKVTDNNATAPESFTIQQELLLDFPSDHLRFSGIELLESFGKPGKETRFVKNGMEMIPYPSDYYPPALGSIKFYAELYHASLAFGADSSFITRYRIEGNESNKTVENLGGIKKEKARDVNVLLAEISFEKLQSGNYFLVIEAVNKENAVLASKKLFFQRSRQLTIPLAYEDLSTIKTEGTFAEKITVADSLKEYIRCLYPISTKNERASSDNQVKQGELKSMQQYFLFFWVSRNRLDPEGAWMEYKAMVNLVNANYQTFNRKGYETDRGRVYLEYGPPNDITTNYYDDHTYPNELWHYYKLKNQQNKKFVFLCRNFATNDFELIHSDATGEISQFRWEDMLQNNQNSHGTDWDITK